MAIPSFDIRTHQVDGVSIAEIVADGIVFGNPRDALELMMNCYYQGHEGIMLFEHNLPPAFFDLKTGIAGEILQKFSTYNMKLAVIGDFSKYPGNSLKDFIRESNKVGRISFVDSRAAAIGKLTAS